MAASTDVQEFEVLLSKFREFINSDSYKCCYQENSTKDNLVHILKGMTSALRLDENRTHMKSHDLESVITVLDRHLVVFHRPDLTSDDVVDLDLVCECFRLLRNCCAGSKVNQVTVGQHPQLVHNLRNIFSSCLRFLNLYRKPGQDMIRQAAVSLYRCGVQFVGNCVSGCSENVDLFWRNLFPVFCELLSSTDGPLKNYACMVIYNCLISPRQTDQFVDSGQLMVSRVLGHLREEDNEWGLYIIQRLLSMKETLKRIWISLDNSEREHLLDILLLGLESTAKEQKEGGVSAAGEMEAVDETNVAYVAQLFSSSVDTLLNPTEAYTDLNPKLLYQMLSCLCAATSVTHLLSQQQMNCLLKSSIRLLNVAHGTGVLQGALSSAPHQQDTLEEEGDLRKSQSAFGLKRNVVRLIGNLVYRNKGNQDLVRELNGIPLILDQTKVDDTNPFIVQWAVLAIRNLCEGNFENQKIVAEMRLQGLADNVTSLRELGVKADLKDGKIVIQRDD